MVEGVIGFLKVYGGNDFAMGRPAPNAKVRFLFIHYPVPSNLMDDMMALSYVRFHDYARGRAMTQDRDGRHDLSVQWMQQDYLRDDMPVVHGL